MTTQFVAPNLSNIVAKKEDWGFTLWRNDKQVGAGNTMSLEDYLGRNLTKEESVKWGKGELTLKDHQI